MSSATSSARPRSRRRARTNRKSTGVAPAASSKDTSSKDISSKDISSKDISSKDTSAASPNPAPGTFRPHPRGFGFVDVAGQPSLFVPPPLARKLIDADQVLVEWKADARGATVTRIVERTVVRRRAVAARSGTKLALQHRFGTSTLPGLPARDIQALPEGHIVAVKLDRRGNATSVVSGPLDPATAAGVEIVALVHALGEHQPSDPAAAVTAERWLDRVVNHQDDVTLDASRGHIPGRDLDRRDLTATPTLTIDGPSTRDIDDAISARQTKSGNVRVEVHIADVAAHVALGSDLDLHARTLASSVYLASRNLPMLPRSLSEDRLSLVADQRRDVLTVAFTVRRDGTTCDVDLHPSAIVSDARLTYDQVDAHLAGTAPVAKKVAPTLNAAARAADLLDLDRSSRRTPEELFDRAHRGVDVASDGTLSVVDVDAETRSNLLIERLMVAANEAVASWLSTRDVPSLYRTHDGVDQDRTGRLEAAARIASVDADLGDLGALLDTVAAASLTHRALLATVAADTFGRAVYRTSPDRHVGLDSRPYGHFTSPIRRYADLTVHRAIRAALAGEAPPQSRSELDDLAAWLTDRSGAAARAEGSEQAGLWPLALPSAAGKLTATLRRVTARGASVRISSHGVTGWLPSSSQLQVDDDALTTPDGTWQVGQRRTVEFDSLDDTGRIVFRPVQRRRARTSRRTT